MFFRERYPRQTATRCPRCGEPLLRWDADVWVCPDCTRFVPTEASLARLFDGEELGGVTPVASAAAVWRLIWRA